MTRRIGAGLAVLAAAIALWVYAVGGAQRFSAVRSPDGREAVDFYSATRWQRWQHPGADLLGSVALRRVSDDTELARSRAFELSGERLVLWDKTQVQVGSSAVYRRAEKRWTVIE